MQESQVKLKIGGKQVVICAYAKGAVSRRASWLVDDPQYVLVQYLVEITASVKESVNFRKSPDSEKISLWQFFKQESNSVMKNEHP